MQMFDMAIKDCEKALELKPDFAKAFSRLGTAHFQAGRLPGPP
jgi:tetratricopeptide (TPR) repeat protein